MSEEQRIGVCKTSVSQICTMLSTHPNRWRDYINLARSVVAHVDATSLINDANRTAEQTWLVTGLQRFAYHDAESGGVPDVAAWCSRQWLAIFQRDARNLAALQGIGQAWLSRAQPTLVRIHRIDGSSSSSGNGSQLSTISLTRSEEERQAAQASVDAERRIGTADYVEARGFLQPATEYLERAVAVAQAQQAVTGDLLSTAAEAYMSLGNVSSPRINEQYFRRAVVLLRAASSIEGFTLSRYLQQYLNDYGRLIE